MSQHFTYPGDGADATVSILNDSIVRASGDSGEITGTDALQEITARAAVRRLKAGQTVTVAIEHSDDGESWDEGDSHEFDGDGDATLTLETPKASTRVTWTITGTNPQPYLTIDLTGSAPTAGQVNQTVKNATPGGGSQPVATTVMFPALPNTSADPFSCDGYAVTSGAIFDGSGTGVLFQGSADGKGIMTAYGVVDADGNFTDGVVQATYAGEGAAVYVVIGGTASDSNLAARDAAAVNNSFTEPPTDFAGAFVHDTTPVTGGLYGWTGSAYVKVADATA